MFLNTAVWIKVMLAILIAFVVSFALTPVVKILAQKVGAMDVPGEARRVHDHPIPRMGGLAIFLGFIVSMLLFVDITQEVRGILLGSIIIVITGVIDDIISLRAWTKFLIQILSAVIAVLHGVVITVVSIAVMPGFLRRFTTDESLVASGITYSTIVFLFATINMAALAFEKMFQAVGRMKVTMVALVLGCVCNILLDALFTMVLPWGLAGAAAATILSQTTTAAAAALCLRRQKNDPVGRRELRPHGPTMLRILPVAAAPFGLSLMPSLITVFTNWQCLRYGGDPAVSAYSVANYFIACALLLLQGIGEGLQPLFSLHQGAGDHRALARLRRQGLLLAMGCSLLFWLISLPAAGLLPRFFGASAATARVMGRAMPLLCMAFPLLGLVKYFTAYYYACGESRRATLLVYGDPVLFTPVCLLVLPPLLGLDGVWLSLPGAQILSALLLLLVSTWHKIKIPAKGGIRCGTESAPTDLTIL